MIEAVLPTKHITLRGFTLPLDGVPLDVSDMIDQRGEAMATAMAPIKFDFVYADIRVSCRCDQQDGGGSHLRILGNAGVLPYTAESPSARAAIHAIVEAANQVLGPTFRLTNGHILMSGERTLPPPVNATALVSEVVRFLVPAKPYLSVIADVVRPPMAPAEGGDTQPVRLEWRRR